MNKGHILIVDDDKDFVKVVKFQLEKNSYKVAEAYDGEEAIIKAKEEKPEIVLLDIRIPKIDGLQVLKALIYANPELYVVMVTGHASLDSAIEALRYGAHDYLFKPLEQGQLETVVRRCLEEVRLQRELKEAQDRLLANSQKLAAIGQLAAGIVHEIANPLAAMRATAEILLKKKKREPEEEEMIKIFEKEASRCQKILKGVLGFAKLPQPEVVPAEINKVIEDTLLLLGTQALLKKIKFITKLDSHLPSVLAVADQLKQAFLNFLLNAFQAMPEGGDIGISTSVQDGKFVIVEFTDTGCGISKENLAHLFEPFFSTKKDTEGTGLGLAVSYGIIHKHNGTIKVTSEVGKGTTVMVKLPAEKAGEK